MNQNTDTTFLLVGHGSRGRTGNQETRDFAARWRSRHDAWRVELCFIEHADILLDAGLDQAARNAAQVVVMPLILNAAGHVKMELPAALARARLRHPEVAFRLVPHLGMGPAVQAVLQRQLDQQMKTLAMPDPQTTGVILLGRGSSDAGANGALARMARWIFEDNDHELVELAFTGVTWPRLEAVVQRQVRLGMMQLVILPVYLFDGVLIERTQQQVARLRGQYPAVAFALGERFGFDEGIFQLLDQRVTAAGQETAAAILLECDGCKYRQLAEDEHLHDHSHTHDHTHDHPHDHGHDHGHPHHLHV
ncbi:MAG: sirohydrochlorin chelatase [Sterolibacterium sp.]|jgi:sirohydrochlorin cobaltochelatase|nr:sirohydrochlorin chelatase [Sterolibacterium sp.]MBP9800337.1 sirohydrochlorin chelatase [Sterolibacterium sp.]